MKRIQIIEDDAQLREACHRRLETDGYQVIESTDGTSGLATALAEKPDLILLDVTLPNMNGLDLLTQMRGTPWGSKVPVIVFTNNPVDDQKLLLLEQGQPSYYLLKAETSLNEISAKIAELIGDAQSTP